MNRVVKGSLQLAASVSAGIFTIFPESFFAKLLGFWKVGRCVTCIWKSSLLSGDEMGALLGRVFVFIVILAFLLPFNWYRLSHSYKTGKDNPIIVKYGDLLHEECGSREKCLIVIPFDECFTTSVGIASSDINPQSICGQYLADHPISNMNELINGAGLKFCEKPSEYQGQPCYEPGSVIRHGDYILMAFSKLDKEGRGHFKSREEYLRSLSKLWDELDKHYGQRPVCMPILGSGTTRIGDVNPSQQELLDMMIGSYKLSIHKLKAPLYIVCKKRKDFSLLRVGTAL